jgi:import receptor subunit TOM22
MEITPAAEAASSDKPFTFTAAETIRVGKKLAWHTGKSAWIFTTSFLILVVPLIIQLHREESMIAMEQEQLGVLSSSPAAPAAAPAAAAEVSQ